MVVDELTRRAAQEVGIDLSKPDNDDMIIASEDSVRSEITELSFKHASINVHTSFRHITYGPSGTSHASGQEWTLMFDKERK